MFQAILSSSNTTELLLHIAFLYAQKILINKTLFIRILTASYLKILRIVTIFLYLALLEILIPPFGYGAELLA